MNNYKGNFPDRGYLMLAVLDWVVAEQMAGRRPNDVGIAKQFDMPLEEAIALHDELEAMGEFD
jgi:hypothetical protein